MNIRTLAVPVLITLLLAGCKKERDIREGSLLKRRIQITTNQTATFDSFLYDTQKRLAGIQYFNSNTNYDCAIEYNAEGKLSRVIYRYMGVERYSCSFVYNDKGQITKKLVTPTPGFEYGNNESYAYDDSGRLISDTLYFRQTSTVQGYTTFTYDSNGNIVEAEDRDFTSPINEGKSIYAYDNHPNPFNILGPAYFYVTGDPAYLNRNNIIKIDPWSSDPITTQYEYQENGLPKKTMTTYPTGPWGNDPFVFMVEYW